MRGICLTRTRFSPDGAQPADLEEGSGFEYVEPIQVRDGQVRITVADGGGNADPRQGWVSLADTVPADRTALAFRKVLRPAAQHIIIRLALDPSVGQARQFIPLIGVIAESGSKLILGGGPGQLFNSLTGQDADSAEEDGGNESEPETSAPETGGNVSDPETSAPETESAVTVESSGPPVPDEEPEPPGQALLNSFNSALGWLTVKCQDDAVNMGYGANVAHKPLTGIANGVYVWPHGPDMTSLMAQPPGIFNSADKMIKTAGLAADLGPESDGLPVVAGYELPFADPGYLFIDGRPSVDDICQGEMGDCFFLSLLASVARYDPQQIVNMITGNFRVLFWRRIEYQRGLAFIFPQPVNVSPVLAAMRVEQSDLLYGARLRIAPGKVRWELRAGEHGQYVRKVTSAQAAMWVPLLEKAFAAFAACYGLSDGDSVRAEETSFIMNLATAPGYGKIGKGIQTTHPLFRVIYGPRLADSFGLNLGEAAAEFWEARPHDPEDPDRDIKAREVLVRQVDSEDLPVAVLTEEPALHTASITGDQPEPVTQASHPAPATQAQTSSASSARPTACRLLSVLLTLQRQEQDAATDPFVLSIVSATRRRVAYRLARLLELVPQELEFAVLAAHMRELTDRALAEAAVEQAMSLDEGWETVARKLLGSLPPSGSLIERIRQLLLMLLNPQAPPRYLLSNHDYALLGASLIFASGQAPGPDKVKDDDLRRVDDLKSTVSIQNPHHRNSPRPVGDTGPDNGAFEMTLRDFLVGFTNLEYAWIRRS